MTRYTMPARSQGKAFMQRTAAFLERDDVHRWIFVRNLTPEVECDVRKWLLQARKHVEIDARGLNDLEAAKALTKATGLNPHMSVYGWPFFLGDLDGVNEAEGGEA